MADFSGYSDEELMELSGGEAMASYSDEDLMSLAGEQPTEQPTQQPHTNGINAVWEGIKRGSTLGGADEAQAAIAAAIPTYLPEILGGLAPEDRPTYGESYERALGDFRQEYTQAQEQHPYLTPTGEVIGAIATAAAATPAALKKGIVNVAGKGLIPKLVAGGGAGGVSGGAYGYGSGEGGWKERLKQGGEYGLIGVGGGVVGSSIGHLGGRMLGLLNKKKAAREVVKFKERAAAPTPTTAGEVLDLSVGQATQNPKLQGLEMQALKGGAGDVAQEQALKAQRVQQEQIRGALGELGAGVDDTALEAAAKASKQAYKSIKHKVNKAYDDARVINKVYINKSPMSEVLKPQVDAIIESGGFKTKFFTPAAQDAFEQITNNPAFKDPKVTSVNLGEMEAWRSNATRLAHAANRKGDPEGVALNRAIESYDNFMNKLPEHALMSGDSEALDTIIKARGLRRRQGVLFERDKVVKNIVQNNDLTNEELANMVLTGKAGSSKIGAGAGRTVRNLKRGIPDENKADFANALKRGTMSRMMDKAKGATLVDGQLRIEPNKLIKELSAVTGNKTFMSELFDEGEQKLLHALQKDLIKINSVQAGADNYSNTAYAMMRFFNDLPLGGMGLSTASDILIKPVAEKGARKALKQNLSPILDDMAAQLRGEARYYGSVAGGATLPEITGDN